MVCPTCSVRPRLRTACPAQKRRSRRRARGGRLSSLPVAFLKPGRFSSHFDEAALDELAGSIRHTGCSTDSAPHWQAPPIATRSLPANGAGGRRKRPHLRDIAGLIQTLTNTQALEIALVENLQRQDLVCTGRGRGLSAPDR